jgi:pSer/pThr/pTyr-binding forkhead associated (FHA) protein
MEPAGSAGGSAEPGPADTTAHLGLFETSAALPRQTEARPPTAMTLADAQVIEALPPTSALLIVQHGPNVGARFLLDAPRTSAGRSPQADIFLDDVTVSRRHAEFRRGPEGYTVHDVGSLNGTYVNRDRIDEVLLGNGDEVQVGKYRLVYYASQHGFGGVRQ